MDELIVAFMNNHYTEELKHDIYTSFGLFDSFEYRDAYSDFIDIILQQDVLPNEQLVDMFIAKLGDKLDYLLDQHKIQLNESASVQQKNEILSGLHLVLDLEDYTPVSIVLESLKDDYEKLASILSDLCLLSEEDILTLVVSIDPTVLALLKEYVRGKEALKPIPLEDNSANIHTLSIFQQLFGENSLGSILITNHMLIGQRFKVYLPFAEDSIVAANDEQTALNFLSLLYMSSDGINNPLIVFRKYSYQILHDINLVSRIEQFLITMVNKVNEMKTAIDVSKQLA